MKRCRVLSAAALVLMLGIGSTAGAQMPSIQRGIQQEQVRQKMQANLPEEVQEQKAKADEAQAQKAEAERKAEQAEQLTDVDAQKAKLEAEAEARAKQELQQQIQQKAVQSIPRP